MSDSAQPLQQRLAALRAEGAARRDPARFHALEAIARRLQGQPDAVRLLLERKLEAGLEELAQRPASPGPVGVRVSTPTSDPLAQLGAHLRAAAQARQGATAPGEPQDPHELTSARRFRQAWDGLRLLQQVEQAVASGPAQAGPLNSHALVLQSLEMMRALSPAYLRRFVAALETLQWLEQAREQMPRAPAKGQAAKTQAAKPTRRKPRAR